MTPTRERGRAGNGGGAPGSTAAVAPPPAVPGDPAAILLAAGAGSRFGAPKLLQPLDGVPLVRRSAERVLAGGASGLTVVLGSDAAAVRAALRGLPARFVVNRHHAAGLAGSLRAGIRSLAPDAAGALIALGDQPGVRPEVVVALLAAFRAGAAPIVAPEYRGFRGNPVVFHRSIFTELLRLRGDGGARDLLAADLGRVHLVPFELPPPDDVDTPDDYRRLHDAWPASGS